MEERAKAFANILPNKEKKFQGHKIDLEKDLKSFCLFHHITLGYRNVFINLGIA